MAITKEIIQDKIEVVGSFKHIQVRTATVIKENGVEISRSFSRHVVPPDISADDLANESADVQAMVAQFHTNAVKTAYADHLANQEV
jgi:homoserine kinase